MDNVDKTDTIKKIDLMYKIDNINKIDKVKDGNNERDEKITVNLFFTVLIILNYRTGVILTDSHASNDTTTTNS